MIGSKKASHFSLEKKILFTLSSLLNCNFTGFDPGSFYTYNYRKYLFSSNNSVKKLWNSFFLRVTPFLGYSLIYLFNLKKVSSTKAISLTLLGLKNLQIKKISNHIDYDSISSNLIKSLLDKRNSNINAWCPDFEYSINFKVISKSSIGVINTSFCCEAIWQWRKKIPNYDKIIIETANSCYSRLPVYEDNKVRCFSYNQNTDYYVHNANLFITLLLLRAKKLDKSLFSYKIIFKHIYYFINDFKKCSIIRYAGFPTESNVVDNYHTGFVIRTLSEINKLIPFRYKNIKIDLDYVIKKGLHTYKDYFIKNHGIPKFHKSKYAVNAHSTAEACLVLDEFKSFLTANEINKFKLSIFKSQNLLWNNNKNYFISDVYVYNNFYIRQNSLFMPRWALAWMFYGLTTIISS